MPEYAQSPAASTGHRLLPSDPVTRRSESPSFTAATKFAMDGFVVSMGPSLGSGGIRAGMEGLQLPNATFASFHTSKMTWRYPVWAGMGGETVLSP